MVRKVYEGYKGNTKTTESATDKKVVVPGKKPAAPRKKAGTPVVVAPMSNQKSVNTKPKIALFIDVDNVGINRENLLEILFYVNGKYKIEFCKLYGYDENTLPGIKEVAGDYNLLTVGKMQFKAVGQNCLDSRLLVDAYECAVNNAKSLDTIFVWCYPCDLANLFEKIIDLGIATATIDNPVFDCKNKYVSQAFKLYSKYDFNVDNPMYGRVKNAEFNNQENEVNSTEPGEVPETTSETSTSVSTPTSELVEPQKSVPQPTGGKVVAPEVTLDDQEIPVLPKREIPERGVHKAVNQEDLPDNVTAMMRPGESLVDSISRKLNIPRPGTSDVPDLDKFEPKAKEANSAEEGGTTLMDMMKEAGFLDDEQEKSKKYEDTIGDL